MLPTINGKSFLDCSKEDLKELIDNPDYRENEYLDFKETFAFLEMPKNNNERQKHIAEFRSDVCAFANANGGYLVYGISDEKGMANHIEGIQIKDNNTDKFELDRKNNLVSILPKIPPVQFKFIRLANEKFVVIIYVHRDSYAPYMHIENESNYKIYKRVGNGKCAVGYVELKNMFNQSLSIDNEVQLYRQKQIDYYRNQEDTPDFKYSKFFLLDIIPDTFTDSTYRKNLFLLKKQKPLLNFHEIFADVSRSYVAQPNVDGLRYPNVTEGIECLLTNNCVAECFFPLHNYLYINEKYPKGYFMSAYFWEKIEKIIREYIEVMKDILETNRVFVCFSVLGCKDVVSENNAEALSISCIDRNTVICNPIVIENINNEEEIDSAIKCFHIEYLLSLGIKSSDAINNLVKEVLGNDDNK